MAAPCVSVFVDGNDAKTRARDLKVLCCYRHRFSYRFHIQLEGPKFLIQYTFRPIKKISLLTNPKGPCYLSVQWRRK